MFNALFEKKKKNFFFQCCIDKLTSLQKEQAMTILKAYNHSNS